MHYLPYEVKIPPSITLDEFLKFIHSISYLEFDSANFRIVMIEQGDGYQFKSEEDIELFRIVLILHLEGVLTIDIQKPGNDNGRSVPELEQFMRLVENQGHRSWLSRKLFGGDDIDGKYDIHSLLRNFDAFHEVIQRRSDGFYCTVSIHGYRFMELLFRKITEYKGIDNFYRRPSIERLWVMIQNKTQGNPDFEGEITIRYDFEEYLEKERFILPFLDTLEKSNVLRIKKVALKDMEFSFVLYKFRGCAESLFKNPKSPQEKKLYDVDFKKGECFINGLQVVLDRKLISTEFLKLACLCFEEIRLNGIEVSELIDGHQKHIETFSKLEEKHLGDNIRTSYLDTINKKIKEMGYYQDDFLYIKKGKLHAKKRGE